MHTTLPIILLCFVVIFGTLISGGSVVSGSNQVIRLGVDTGHSNLHTGQSEISDFTGLIKASGGEVLFSTGPLNQTFMNSIGMLLISSPTLAYNADELGILRTWYINGGKLWLSATSENTTASANLNAILQAIGSTLAFEYGYTSDTLFNVNSSSAGADSVLLPLINHQTRLLGEISSNVRTLLSFRPVPVISWNGVHYSKFNSTSAQNATWIAETTSSARVFNSSNSPLNAYVDGENGRIPIAAAEVSIDSKLIISGYPNFSAWKGLFVYNPSMPQDNRVLVENIVDWLTGFKISIEPETFIPRLLRVASPTKVLIDESSNNQHMSASELLPLYALVYELGLNATLSYDYSYGTIKGANAIIIQAPHLLIPPANSSEVAKWFDQGNKTLILASMADYAVFGSATESLSLNGLLSAMNSSLRFEQGDVLDPELNLGGSSYYALSSLINHGSPNLGNITTNVRSIFLQFATVLAYWNGTNALPLEPHLPQLQNVAWIAKTSNSSIIHNLGLGFPLLAYREGETGSFITVAQEKYSNGGRIILVGGPLFSDFSSLLDYPTIYGYPVDNVLFVRNILASTLTNATFGATLTATTTTVKVTQGEPVTFNINYYVSEMSTSNLTRTQKFPIRSANVTITALGSTIHAASLPNGTYAADLTLSTTGTIPWKVSASAGNYAVQVASGSVQVTPQPANFTFYVLGVPVVIFIAVTLVVVARKTR